MNCVAVTGYYSSGSGAVIDLLREYDSIDDGKMPDYEHLFLYIPDGVFDTIDTISFRNNLFHSNAVIDRFRKRMQDLNETDYGWYGGLKYKTGNQFEGLYESFISEISDHISDREWYGQFEGRKWSVSRIIRDTGALVLKRRRLTSKFGKEIYVHKNGGEYSFADRDRLNQATTQFTKKYIEMLYPDGTNKIALLNHMLLPQDAYRIKECMPEGMKLIIVDKDIRDLYIYNKYIWKEWGYSSFFPTEIDRFISFMKGYRKTEQIVNDEHILRVQFEDLIYHYKEEKKRIEDFLDISDENHIRSKQVFDPLKSIKNTQVYNLYEGWREEIQPLMEAFPDLIYDFPYKNQTSIKETFDGVK